MSDEMVRTRSTTTIIGQLNREWDQMVNDRALDLIVRAWAATDIRLSGLDSLEAIEAASRRPIDGRTDLLLSALLDRATERGEEGDLAARIVVQLMLGRAVISSRGLRGAIHDGEERAQLVVVAMWEAIREFPAGKRQTYIAPWLAWDIHARARRAARSAGAEIPVADVHEFEASTGAANASEELAKVLVWSVAEGVLSTDEADLLVARYGNESPGRASWSSVGDPAAIAQEHGISQQTMRKRTSRATRKLSQAAARYIATNVF